MTLRRALNYYGTERPTGVSPERWKAILRFLELNREELVKNGQETR